MNIDPRLSASLLALGALFAGLEPDPMPEFPAHEVTSWQQQSSARTTASLTTASAA